MLIDRISIKQIGKWQKNQNEWTWTGHNWADCFRVKLFCLIDLKCQPSCDYSLIEGCSRTQKCGTVVLWSKLENMDEIGLGCELGVNEKKLIN